MSSGGKHERLFVSALHVLVSSSRGHAFYFCIFPCFTPCMRFSPHTAFHRRILADLRPSLRYSLQVPSSLRPLLFSTGSAAYCSSSAYILLWMPNTFPRSDNPIRYHTPLGACYGTDDFFGSLSYASPYLAASSTCIAAWTVSLYFAGSSDRNGHTHHGYFMDHRHISWLLESTFCRLHRASYG